MPLTGEVEGEVLESAPRFIGVATENVAANEPLDEVVAAFLDNRVVDRLQLHLKGDADIAEFACIVAGLINLLAAEELVADSVRGPPYKAVRLFLSLTAESQCKSLNETQVEIRTTRNIEYPLRY